MGACAVFNRDVITQPTCCGHKVTLRAKGHFIKRRQALIAISSALVCVCVFVGVGVGVNIQCLETQLESSSATRQTEEQFRFNE